jgi:integrase/recombinase XerC
MRIERAVDAFLDWRQLERDATPRSVDSYRRILSKLAEDYPESRIDELGTTDLRTFLKRWGDRSASTRANIVSVLHSFFAWAEAEDLVDVDPSRKIRRPPKRRPDIYRPSLEELTRVRSAAGGHKRPAIVLMEGAGLRRSEVIGCRWADLDIVRGRVRVHRKGHHWHWLPLDPDVVGELRRSFSELQPELDDHVFTVEVEQWISAYERERRRKDPKQPASDQALMRMVWRVCARAGVRRLSPHQLRHGFANRFLRESGRDFVALQALMGHSRPDTTQQYTDEVELDELAEALDRAAHSRYAQASPDPATLETEVTAELRALEWRRRESNPRPRTHRLNVYKLRLPFDFVRRPVDSRPTDGLALLQCRASGEWLSLRA